MTEERKPSALGSPDGPLAQVTLFSLRCTFLAVWVLQEGPRVWLGLRLS